jgi:CelD/BcsL family acetyltransferase involved in cellulose biosynthesis
MILNTGLTCEPMEISSPRWLEFVTSQPSATIFNHPSWAQLLSESYGYKSFAMSLRNDANRVIAGLPVIEVKGLLGRRRLVSLPFTDYSEPLYADPIYKLPFIERLKALHQQHPARQLEIRAKLPPQEEVSFSSDYVLNLIPLSDGIEHVSHNICRMHRQNIRKAKRCGVTIESGHEEQHLRAFYALHLETRRRKGVPIQPWSFFRKLGELLLASGLGFVLLAYHEDRCIAGAVFLHFNRTLTYKYGASASSGLLLRPNNLIMWTAIEWGCHHGYHVLDMGRTQADDAGLRRYKNGWGGEENELVYSSFGPYKPSSLMRQVTPWSATAIRHSPRWVCQALGQLLYRYAG